MKNKIESNTESDRVNKNSQFGAGLLLMMIGFGDVIKRTTSYLGIRPCQGCEQSRCA